VKRPATIVVVTRTSHKIRAYSLQEAAGPRSQRVALLQTLLFWHSLCSLSLLACPQYLHLSFEPVERVLYRISIPFFGLLMIIQTSAVTTKRRVVAIIINIHSYILKSHVRKQMGKAEKRDEGKSNRLACSWHGIQTFWYTFPALPMRQSFLAPFDYSKAERFFRADSSRVTFTWGLISNDLNANKERGGESCLSKVTIHSPSFLGGTCQATNAILMRG
jgi:hypothetical protein